MSTCILRCETNAAQRFHVVHINTHAMGSGADEWIVAVKLHVLFKIVGVELAVGGVAGRPAADLRPPDCDTRS